MCRVLIVEDEALIALAAEMALEAAGHDVVGTAATADDAVAMAFAHEPDLMIVDLRLRDGSSGPEAVARVRARLDVAIIFASGNLDRQTRDRLAAFDPVAMIGKPYTDDQLVKAVAAAG